MKRLLLALAAIAALWLAGRALVFALASDETLIRWRVESMRDGYNDGDVGDAIGPLHSDWRHEDYELDRELLHGALVHEFFQAGRDPETKALLRRVAFDEDTLAIEVTDDTATLEAVAWFSRRDGEDAWRETWRARIEAELVRTDDGWKVLASRHEDVSGTQLSR